MRFIFLSILLLQANNVIGQEYYEKELIISLLKQEAQIDQIDTIYKRDGKIKEIIKRDTINLVLVNESLICLRRADDSYFKRNGLPQVDTALITNYFLNNQDPISFDSIVSELDFVTLISKEKYHSLNYETFHKKYANHLLTKLSRPAFNKTRDKAIIFIVSEDLYRHEWRNYVYLEKTNDNWIIKGKT